MSRVHVSNGEPKPCSAQPGNCPVGGDHYDTVEEAYAAEEAKLEREHGAAGTVSKKPDLKSKAKELNYKESEITDWRYQIQQGYKNRSPEAVLSKQMGDRTVREVHSVFSSEGYEWSASRAYKVGRSAYLYQQTGGCSCDDPGDYSSYEDFKEFSSKKELVDFLNSQKGDFHASAALASLRDPDYKPKHQL